MCKAKRELHATAADAGDGGPLSITSQLLRHRETRMYLFDSGLCIHGAMVLGKGKRGVCNGFGARDAHAMIELRISDEEPL